MGSTVPKVRFVRCPKCHQIIAELADIPVYKCGGCETVLHAKYHIASGQNVTSGSLENSSQNLSDGTFVNGGLNSLGEQMIASSSGLDNAVEQVAPPNSFSELNAAVSCVEKGESSGHDENGGEEKGSDQGIPNPTNPQALEIETNLNEQVERSLKLSPRGHNSLRPSDKMKESAEYVSQSVASEEEMVDRECGDGHDDSLRSTTRSSYAYDASASSADDHCNNRVPNKYLLLSKRTFRRKKVSNSIDDKRKEAGEDGLVNDKVTTDMGSQLHARNLPAKSSNERYASATVGSSDSKRYELSSRHGKHAPDRETSFNSEDFHSVQNWMEPENNSPSGSLLKDPVFQGDSLNHQNDNPSTEFRYQPNHIKILRKVDELRDELSELFDQKVEGKRPHDIGTQQKDLTQCSHSNLLRPPPGAYLPRKNVPQQVRFSQSPFSRQHHSSCLHCHPEGCRLSAQVPPKICCHNELCRACGYNMCCHPSKAVSPQPPTDSSLPPQCHKAQVQDHESEKLHRKEKRQPIKRHCRPVSGGAPFVICYKCLKLLQLPADFLVSRGRLHKLQCGSCSEVLMFSFKARVPRIPRTPIEIQHPPSEVDRSTDVINGGEISTSHSNDYPRGDPFSYSEEYGLSFARSDATEPGPVLHVSRNSSDLMEEQNGMQMKDTQLHRLLGYSSASELLYRRDSVDEGYQSTEPTTPQFCRPHEECDIRYRLKGTGTRTPHHEHSEAGPSSNVMEICEEDESPERLRTRRGPAPLRGLLKKGIQELNHGLESVKLKIHSKGRIIPAS